MTISSSLNAGIAGLSANASRLATISDNIANSSTFGYKRVRTDFQSMVIDPPGGTYSAGGVRAVTTRLIDESGSLVATSNSTDLAIRGRGMLPVALQRDVRDGNGAPEMLLTTTGSFRPDADGYLTTESGLVLLALPAAEDGTVPAFPRDTPGALEPVRINFNEFIGEPTTEVKLAVNLPAGSTEAGSTGDIEEFSIEYQDNLGKPQQMLMTFTPTVPATGESNEWTLVITDNASGGAVIGEYTLTFDDSRADGGLLQSVATVSGGAYSAATGSLIVNVADGPIEITIGAPNAPDGFSQLGDKFAPVEIYKDGLPVANVTGVEIDANGFVHAVYSSGADRIVYKIPLVDLPNPNGMVALDLQTYKPSSASGNYFLWDAGEGPTGEIVAFAREESATDVATELTAMIQTQRAYSSNAKVIQTVDEMLQETTNIKR